MTITTETFEGWAGTRRLSNGIIDLVIPTAIGPRILFAGFTGGANHFHIFAENAGKTGDAEWLPYGGHRLWAAPEHPVRTYQPDNVPIGFETLSETAVRLSGTEAANGLYKEMEVELAADQPAVRVIHRLRNDGPWPIKLAVWPLSMMAQGGTLVLALPPRGTHPENLLPCNSMAMWAYTNMADPRWTWGERFILLRQDPKATTPQKIGLRLHDGWAAYANHNELFVNIFDVTEKAHYPDLGCNYESFTNGAMLEVESLGPLITLEPGATVAHTERWAFFKDIPAPASDAEAEKHVLPAVAEAKKNAFAA